MISPQTVEEIKNRINIIDIIGDFVKLKRRGNSYIGLCPFHNERSPSFNVSPAKELYKCFGCGKSGNAIGFLMEHEKLSYPESLRWLAGKYNIEIEETEVSEEQRQQFQVADSLFIINAFAEKYFTTKLLDTDEGRLIALAYLKERGFTESTIKRFHLGYNPNIRDALAKELLYNQFNKDLLPQTGLVNQRNGQEWVDNYRGRIIFPIHNLSGKTIGFGARVIGKADKAPKYINTPENELYSKSKILYGMFFARLAIDRADECLLVEGYTDVISLSQAGIENVVASGGTSLTPDQLRLIRKYTQNLTIIYDGDDAGVKAAVRGLDLALEEGLNVKVVLIPAKEDPDGYVRKVGAEYFKLFIKENKKDFILFKLENLIASAGNNIQERSEAVKQVASTLSKLNRQEEFGKRQEYIRLCAQMLKIDESGFASLVQKQIDEAKLKQKPIEQKQPEYPTETIGEQAITDSPAPVDENQMLLSPDENVERNIIRLLLEWGAEPWEGFYNVTEYIFQEIEGFHFDHPQLSQMLELIRTDYMNGIVPNDKNFLYHPDVSIQGLVAQIVMQPYHLSPKWEANSSHKIKIRAEKEQDVESGLMFYKLRKLKKMIKQNQEDLEKAEPDKLIEIIGIHSSLKTMERELAARVSMMIY